MILLVNFERPTTCRYDMPHVVAYVVAYVVLVLVFVPALSGCLALHALGGQEQTSRTKEPVPIREAAFASLKAPLRPVPAPVDPTDASEGREASGQRTFLRYGSRKTTARQARSW